MSEYVVRGSAAPAQRYLDGARAAAAAAGAARGGLAGLVLHCMRENPDNVFMINAATDTSFTNAEIVSCACRVSRAVSRRAPPPPATPAGEPRARAVIMLRNHEHHVAVFFGLQAAGVVPLMLNAPVTALELQLFFEFLKPNMIFCEAMGRGEAESALRATGQTADVIVMDGEGTTLADFTAGCSGEWGDDVVVEVEPGDTTLLVSTSGSTGLPKGVPLTHDALIAHLPFLWIHHSHFPRPERRALLIAEAQWITHSLILTSAPVYQVPIVMTPLKLTPDYLLEVIEKYQISWAMMSPPLAGGLASALAAAPRALSLRHLLLTGAPPPADVVHKIKHVVETLSGGVVKNGYGMSEAQGFVCVAGPGAPPGSIGQVFNILHYKIVDEDGRECAPGAPGELLLKSDRVMFKSYYKNEEAYRLVVEDGWYRTGDCVRCDELGNIFYVQRLKFIFKYFNHQISPEEVEGVVCGVRGVQACVVSESPRGPAALVVAPEPSDRLADSIHAAVNASLSDPKRLRGGVFFVPALPTTRSGKLQRHACRDLLLSLL